MESAGGDTRDICVWGNEATSPMMQYLDSLQYVLLAEPDSLYFNDAFLDNGSLSVLL
jgi:hypothetical protein